MDKQEFIRRFRSELQDMEYMSGAAGGRPDYVQGRGGCASVELKDELFAVKAAGGRPGDLRVESGYAVLELEKLEHFFEKAAPEAGSEESAVRAALCDAEFAITGMAAQVPALAAGWQSMLEKFTLHTHSVWANIFNCAADGEAALTSALRGSGIKWCFVKYASDDAALAYAVKAALAEYKQATGSHPDVLFLQNHGLALSAHDEEDVTMLHEMLNGLLAMACGLDTAAYPSTALAERADGRFVDAGGYLGGIFASGGFGARELLEEFIYPGQQELRGAVQFAAEECGAQCSVLPDGAVIYNCGRARAQELQEIITAVAFIRGALKSLGRRAQIIEGR